MPNNKRLKLSKGQYQKKDKLHGAEAQLDPIFGQYRALPIPLEKLQSITPDTIPEDGETYLAMVRKQAESGSSVMFIKSNIDYGDSKEVEDTGFKQNSTKNSISEEEKKFYNDIITEFKSQRNLILEVEELQVPSDFIYPTNFTEWRKYIMDNDPILPIITNFDHELTIRLVIYCTKWLTNKTPDQVSKWIYALLIKLNDLLEISDQATLRDLALKAKKLHDKDSEKTGISQITIRFVLIIISRFFGQKDLDLV
ncbi:hypothetical protein WICMUC_001915 [Wickerhamomyces mucosus]|uniref:Survival motor neuron interacting protein 1 n=1 Tax=Wickerhamomyces mucosus TaxID=1378264 RepID=A0A9P8PTG4_9ASCO|nr:hypothetical protein WICMUC_001915 [Wickerhamomyces mucosus]